MTSSKVYKDPCLTENSSLFFIDKYIKKGLESYLKGFVYNVPNWLSIKASTILMYNVTSSSIKTCLVIKLPKVSNEYCVRVLL